MRNAPLRVEFVGLPGAGKSELSRRVAQVLSANGVTVDQPSYVLAHGISRPRRMLRKSLHVARELILHPWRAMAAARAIATTKQPSVLLSANLLFNWLLVTALARRGARTGSVQLHDQGIFQISWSIALSGDQVAAVEMLRRRWPDIPSPDLVVIVEASIPAVGHRLRSRPESDSRMDRLYLTDPHILDRCSALLDHIKDALATVMAEDSNMKSMVLVNETAEDLDVEAQRLAAAIQSMARVG